MLDNMSLTKSRTGQIAFSGLAYFLIATSLSAPAAIAGAITDTTPPSQGHGDTADWNSIPSGPVIDFGSTLDNQDSNASDSLDEIQQTYVPWIVQDRRSLDWFGGPADILSGTTGSENLIANNAAPNSDQQPSAAYSYDDLPARTYTVEPRELPSRSGQQLDMTLTKLVAGIFQSLGYVNTIFVLGPIVVIGMFIGLMHLAKILRVSQGLDPEQGTHRWGIQRDGQFGHVSESNDNRGRPHRKKRDVV